MWLGFYDISYNGSLQYYVSGHSTPFLQQSVRSWSAFFAHCLFQFYLNFLNKERKEQVDQHFSLDFTEFICQVD